MVTVWMISAGICVIFHLGDLYNSRTSISSQHMLIMMAYVLFAPLGILHVLLEIGLRISSIGHKPDPLEARYYNRLN